MATTAQVSMKRKYSIEDQKLEICEEFEIRQQEFKRSKSIFEDLESTTRDQHMPPSYPRPFIYDPFGYDPGPYPFTYNQGLFAYNPFRYNPGPFAYNPGPFAYNPGPFAYNLGPFAYNPGLFAFASLGSVPTAVPRPFRYDL